jgi:hypothetical protein
MLDLILKLKWFLVFFGCFLGVYNYY